MPRDLFADITPAPRDLFEDLQEPQATTLDSYSEAMNEKSFMGRAKDIAQGIYEPVVGLAGAIPQFMEGTARKGISQGQDMMAGNELSDPAVQQRAQEAQGNTSGFSNSIAEFTAPTSETGQFAFEGLGKLFEKGTELGAQSIAGYEQFRRTIIQNIPGIVGDLARSLPGQEVMSEKEMANLEEGAKTGIEVGMALTAAKGLAHTAKRAYNTGKLVKDRFNAPFKYAAELRKNPDAGDPVSELRKELDLQDTHLAKYRNTEDQQFMDTGEPKPAKVDLNVGVATPTKVDFNVGTPGKLDLNVGKPGKQRGGVVDVGEPGPPAGGVMDVGQPAPAKPTYSIFTKKGAKRVKAEIPNPQEVMKKIEEVDLGKSNERPGADKNQTKDARKAHLTRIYERFFENDFRGILDELADGSDSFIFRTIAKLMRDLPDFKADFVLTDDPLNSFLRKDRGASPVDGAEGSGAEAWGKDQGYYYPEFNLIAIRVSGRTTPIDQMIMHEMTHAAIYHLQKMAAEKLTGVGARGVEAAIKIERLYDKAKAHLEGNLDYVMSQYKDLKDLADGAKDGYPYGFSSVYEFIAEAVGNPRFQAFLRDKELWGDFVEAVRDDLAVPIKEMDLLDQVLDAGGKAIHESKQELRTGYWAKSKPLRSEGTDSGLTAYIEGLPQGNRAIWFDGKVYQAKGKETHGDILRRILLEKRPNFFTEGESPAHNQLADRLTERKDGVVDPNGKFLTHDEVATGKHGYFKDNTGDIKKSLAEEGYAKSKKKLGSEGYDSTHADGLTEIKKRLWEAEAKLDKLIESIRNDPNRKSDAPQPLLADAQREVQRINKEYNTFANKRLGSEVVKDPEGKLPDIELADADLDVSLSDRMNQTIKIGEDMNWKAAKDWFTKLPNDIGAVFDKWILPVEQMTFFNGIINPLVKSYIDKIGWIKRAAAHRQLTFMEGMLLEVDSLKEALPPDMVRTSLGYIKRSGQGFRGLIEFLSPEGQMDFFNIKISWDNDPMLKRLGQQWPTTEQMLERGARPEAIVAYQLETRYLDLAFDMINKARAMEGQKPIRQVPGYMPHMYKGHMGIKIKVRIPNPKDAKGYSEHTAGYTRAAGSIKSLQRTASELWHEVQLEIQAMKDGGASVEVMKPEIARADHAGSSMDMISALESTADAYAFSEHPVGKIVHKALTKRMSAMERQFLQHQMKRVGVPGWIGQFGKVKLKDLVDARDAYMKNVFKFLENSELKHKVIDTLSPEQWTILRDKLPRTEDFMQKFGNVARERFPLAGHDVAILDMFAKITGDRFSYRSPLLAMHKVRSWFAMLDLAWSVSYHTGNAVQPEAFGSIALVREASRMGKGDPLTSMAISYKEVFDPSPLNRKALLEASKLMALAPKLMMEVDMMIGNRLASGASWMDYAGNMVKEVAGGRTASMLNETFGRTRSFLMAVEFYRSAGFKEPAAIRAAVKMTDNIMVDYNSSGQPLWLSHNPFGQIVGRVIAPYAAFRHSFWGHTALALQALKRNPGLKRKIAPLLQMQFATGLFAGLRGIAFMAELQLMVGLVNEFWEWKTGEEGFLPDPEKIMLESGLHDAALFGIMSEATKVIPGLEHGSDIGTTLTSPSITEFVTPRSLAGMKAAIEAGATMIKAIRGDVSEAEKFKALRGTVTPGWAAGILEWSMHPEDSMHTGRDYNNRGRGTVDRDEADWNARKWGGKRSLKEQRELMIGRHMKTDTERLSKRKADMTEIAADQMEKQGYITAELIDRAADEGYTYSQFSDKVEGLIEERKRSRIRRYVNTSEDTRERRRQRELSEMLGPDFDFLGYNF